MPFKKITDLGSLASADANDQVEVADTSAALSKRVTIAGLAGGLTGTITPDKLLSGAPTTWTWQTWSPTFTGFSSSPAGGVYRYCRVGNVVHLMMAMPNAGTSNSNDFQISLPVTAKTAAGAVWTGNGQIQDNGSVSSQPGLIYIPSAGTTAYVFVNWGGNGFTASGSKRVIFGGATYEAA